MSDNENQYAITVNDVLIEIMLSNMNAPVIGSDYPIILSIPMISDDGYNECNCCGSSWK